MLTITVIISGPGLYLNPWSRKSSLSSLTNLIKDQELRCNPWILTGYIWPNHSYRLWHLDWTTQWVNWLWFLSDTSTASLFLWYSVCWSGKRWQQHGQNGHGLHWWFHATKMGNQGEPISLWQCVRTSIGIRMPSIPHGSDRPNHIVQLPSK